MLEGPCAFEWLRVHVSFVTQQPEPCRSYWLLLALTFPRRNLTDTGQFLLQLLSLTQRLPLSLSGGLSCPKAAVQACLLRGKGRPGFKAMKSHNCRGCPALEGGDLHTADPVDVFLVYNSAPRRPHRSQAPLPQILHSTQLPARKSYQH